MARLWIQTYSKEPKLCVVSHYRDTYKLFLTCIKPYRTASKDTISRWSKSIIKESGISIHSYTCHSSRAAASSYAKFRGASLSTIMQSAGWKSESIFDQFYDKQTEEVEFQNYLLQKD